MPRPPISLKARALRYLSAREHSRQELARKLSRYAQEGDDIEALLDSLEAANFQSQERFSESLVNRRAARFGNTRILAELHTHGIEADKLNAIKHQLAEDEVQRACDVWQRKFGTPPSNPAEKARQMRFLQQRGFSHKAIQAALTQAQAAEE
jgi:regulatory protein